MQVGFVIQQTSYGIPPRHTITQPDQTYYIPSRNLDHTIPQRRILHGKHNAISINIEHEAIKRLRPIHDARDAHPGGAISSVRPRRIREAQVLKHSLEADAAAAVGLRVPQPARVQPHAGLDVAPEVARDVLAERDHEPHEVRPVAHPGPDAEPRPRRVHLDRERRVQPRLRRRDVRPRVRVVRLVARDPLDGGEVGAREGVGDVEDETCG